MLAAERLLGGAPCNCQDFAVPLHRLTGHVHTSSCTHAFINFNTLTSKKKERKNIMKKEAWKQLIQIIITVLTAVVTTLGTASCIGS